MKTVQQAAFELGVAVVTIRSWIAQRKIEYVRLGRSIRIPAVEIHKLIEMGRVPAKGR